MAEIPCVIVDAQRGGPSTGMPTKTEQSDLNHALYGGHGEAPRVVMAPIIGGGLLLGRRSTPSTTAERFQVPVILLTDQCLAPAGGHPQARLRHGRAVGPRDVRPGAERRLQALRAHRRSRLADGRSPAARAASTSPPGIEHDEAGHPALRARAPRGDDDQALAQARAARATASAATSHGDRAAPTSAHRLGLHRGRRCCEAAEICARAAGCQVGAFYPRVLGAAPGRAGHAVAAERDRACVVPELNFTGQFARLVRAECGLEVESHAKATGLPFTRQRTSEDTRSPSRMPECEHRLRPKRKPTDYKSDLKPIWCPGCGDFGVLAAALPRVRRAGPRPRPHGGRLRHRLLQPLPGFVTTYGFHGAPRPARCPVAMGVKLANPELNVIAVGGDGDGFAIGGGHFPHAARRNVDITYLVMDNEIYGLTKGQVSPTSLHRPEGALDPVRQPRDADEHAGVRGGLRRARSSPAAPRSTPRRSPS